VKDKVIGFVLGCLLTGLVLGIYASALKAELSTAQNETKIQQMSSTQQRDACQIRFSRSRFSTRRRRTSSELRSAT
jgi:hypothetical protein